MAFYKGSSYLKDNKKYNWPLNDVVGEGHHHPLLKKLKSTDNLWLSKNLTTNSLLLTRNLTNTIDGRLTCTLYMLYVFYNVFLQ